MKRSTLQISFILALCSCCFFMGCTTYKMSVIEGDFDVTLQQPVRGAEFKMKENSKVTRVSLSTNGYGSKESKLSRVWTGAAYVRDGDERASKEKYSEKIDPGRADMTYSFKQVPLSLQVEWFKKSELKLVSLGVGLDYMPYGTVTIGMNGCFGELGAAAYLGIDINRTKYLYEGISASEPFIQSWPEPEHFTDQYDEYQLHLRAGVGAFAGAFFGPITLTYAPMIHFPQFLTNELEGQSTGYNKTDAEITFDFPFYLSNYFGVTYNFHKSLQYSIGVTVINGYQLNERLYFGSASISWLL